MKFFIVLHEVSCYDVSVHADIGRLRDGILEMVVNGDVYASTVGFYYRLYQEVLP